MGSDAYGVAIRRHYEAVWAGSSTVLQWTRGPTSALIEGFSIIKVAQDPGPVAYGTCLMSEPGEKAIELHVLAKHADQHVADESVTELLTAVAYYHHTTASLGLHHTVNFGRGWLPGSACTHGLISLPYLDGPRLENIEGYPTRFLWLVPITAAELAFKKQKGIEALEQRFEESGFDYLDPGRESVV